MSKSAIREAVKILIGQDPCDTTIEQILALVNQGSCLTQAVSGTLIKIEAL
jgi:hypothetical protein